MATALDVGLSPQSSEVEFRRVVSELSESAGDHVELDAPVYGRQ